MTRPTAVFKGAAVPVPLGVGYAILAPGFSGSATLVHAHAALRTLEDGTPELEQALAATGMVEQQRVELDVQRVPQAAAAPLRAAGTSADEAIELQAPAPPAGQGQVVLAVGHDGALSWHLPLDDFLEVQPAVAPSGPVQRFRIPVRPAPPAGDAFAQERSLVGTVGRQLLKVLAYPLAGAAARLLASAWEKKKRDHLVRTLTPHNRRQPRAGALTGADWARLGSGRALLFVHGTFSSCHGAFGELPDAVFDALHAQYQGRVFGFDHPTMATTPQENVEWLLEQVPAGVQLDVDVVCHSRGGLVARVLAERPSVFGIDAGNWRVGKVVMVAVPNSGTPLADGRHMVAMVDRLSTALNVLPGGPVVETMEALITVVKVAGHGALDALHGLKAMHPKGDFLFALNTGHPGGAGYRAVAVDFKAQGGPLAAIALQLGDAALDVVFGDQPNDLVVPELGVWSANGCGAFPIAAPALLQVKADAGVLHTNIFAHPPVAEALAGWLRETPAGP